ncbi:MAG TPA: hypothetical protein ENN80_00425 [Candidatus Hydrogenedentes bacterium]|nr:hypothetical protein [Candidatus Hydrogenedentota bacterium]
MAKRDLDKQSRVAVVFAAAAMALVAFMGVFVYAGPYKDYLNSAQTLERLKTQETEALLVRVDEEQNQLELEEIAQRIEAREPRFDLKGFMSRVLRDAELAERSELQNLKPSERLMGEYADNLSIVQLKLHGVSLSELVDLLHDIYASKNLVVMHKLDGLRTDPNVRGLDFNATFLAPKSG